MPRTFYVDEFSPSDRRQVPKFRESYVARFLIWLVCIYIVISTLFGTGWLKKLVVSQLEQLAVSLLPAPIGSMVQMMVGK